MPKRRLYGKRRRFRGRKRRRKTIKAIVAKTPYARCGPAIAHRQKAVLRYNAIVNLNPAAGVVATHQFSANGLYDPDWTGTGHQPMGFDEMMNLYSYYRVLWAKITCTVLPQGSTDYVCGIHMSPAQNDVVSSVQRFRELPTSKWVTVRYGTVGGATKQVSMTVKPSKFMGVRSDDADCKGTAAANPIDECFFNVCVMPFNESNDLGVIGVQVYITYFAEFIEPHLLPQS